MLKTKSLLLQNEFFRTAVFNYRFMRQGCKGFSSFPALFLCAGKNRSEAKPPHLRRDKLCSPAFRLPLAEGGALKKRINDLQVVFLKST
jgi:hypothetical protein